MVRRPVTSSNLRSVGYEQATQTLEVEFHNGSIYQYHGVPQRIYDGLMAAPSHGSYLDANVKKGGYRFTRVH